MARFSELYTRTSKPVLSVEVFPPKTPKGWANLYYELYHLTRHKPGFVSVTYGAGGSTRKQTLELMYEIRTRFRVESVPHFTCVGATKESVREYLDRALALGAQNIVALRGDPPRGETTFKPAPGGFRYAYELVRFVREYTDQMDIAVAGYPEGHVETPDLATSVQHLKLKVDQGASIVITQLFYDNADFFRFRDLAVKAGINVPIIPGLLPIIKYSQIDRITRLCGAKMPQPLIDRLVVYPDGSVEQHQAGIEYAIEQARELLENGVPGIHIFTLNNSHATSRMVEVLGSYFDPGEPSS